ncbi:NAD(P)H-dependent flavin oxidoreductase [Blastococcus mobilis]|uniref:Nitronate monooxygenase n=1 Tax=Blastococcus mobilis TaxID=1938746 RepID=A0A238ZE44_9ACTN|nr:nitronate monooxygenase [Blastococcus mobilis]SNR81033.1 nitronate monooxygenase [Blastococcus mobilis]
MAAAPRLPAAVAERLRIPAIAAPMLAVSGPELVAAACRSGVVGAFPTVNARSTGELDDWLSGLATQRGNQAWAPWCPNLIIRQPRLADDLETLVRHRVEMVITSVGPPAEVVPALHDAGALVLADVATMRHAQRAVEAGVDGLVLLTAGAGGQTGWLNPFSFVREVRRWYDGLVILAGGIGDGVALRAARTLGADLGYLGTRFIATEESRAAPAYKQMLVDSGMDDVVLTKAFTGLATSMLRPSIEAAGLDPERLDEQVRPETAAAMFGSGAEGPRRWTHIWSAGHSVSAVASVPSVATLTDELTAEYHATE